MSKQTSTSLSSALSVALSNIQKDVSFFILLNEQYKHYCGRLSNSNQVTKFKSESLYQQLDTKYITSSLMKLSGMIDLFCINIGKHVRITNELTIKSRYTFILEHLNGKEWLKVKDDFNFNKSERNLLINIGTKLDPIHNFQFSCIFNSINMNEPKIDNLDIKKAHNWEIRFNQATCKDSELEMSDKLKKFVNNVYLKNSQETYLNTESSLINRMIKEPKNSSYINELIYDIFDTSGDQLFACKAKLIVDHDKPIKSCLPNSLMRRFCDHVIRIKSKDDLQTLWKLFNRVLFKYWEESMGQDSETKKLLSEFPINTSFIPFTNTNVNWSTCLLEQKIDMLNICCLKECSQVAEKIKKDSETVLEDDEWKDSGFETLSDLSEEDEYFDVNGGDSEDLTKEQLQNILETIDVSGKTIRIPKTQNPPLNTEDVIEEEREIIANMTSSDQRARYQCEGLISDMQAFKFVNPKCDFSDFLLWYSPKDVNQDKDLSNRMKINENNIWKIFWDETQPIPILKQKPIFDHKLQAEKIIHTIETMDFTVVMEQILICTLSSSYYLLKEWWIDSIMDGVDIFSENPSQPITKLDDSLPIIRVIETKFKTTRDELRKLTTKLSDKDSITNCVELIQDLELSISIVLSIVSKLTSRGKTSFSSIHPELIKHVEGILTNSIECSQFNTDTDNRTHESICEFINAYDNHIEKASEFILRCSAQRPYLISSPTNQMMYALVSRDEIRVCTSLTDKVPW